jgi:type IV pilus assembly protein PilA
MPVNRTERKRISNRNAGFSLVELIIVVAIMAVLVGVLAPQYVKYVENSRRTLDINNANEIREAVLVAVADNMSMPIDAFEVNTEFVESHLKGLIPSDEIPVVQGNVANKGHCFWAKFNANTGICSVYNKKPEDSDWYDLTSYDSSEAYRNAN